MKLAIVDDCCSLARRLVTDGLDGAEILEFYRGDVLCLRGRADAFARVTVRENRQVGPVFARWRPVPPDLEAQRRHAGRVAGALKSLEGT